MTPETFIAKWKTSTLKERSASQSHFNDLCAVIGVENPIDADQKGDWYCFERGASKTAGGEGWADVWKRGHFGWEYKGKRKDLTAAFAQLQQYAVALENPPLLVVSDMDRIIVHTNWTNTVSERHEIALDDLVNPEKRELLRWVFQDPDRLKPQKTIDALTKEVANKFAALAIRLRDRKFEPHQVAHFVNRLVFCMFAEDINLLPRHLFTQILDRCVVRPELSEKLFSQLFETMRKGGLFGIDEIKYFNGGLFDDASAIALTRDELKLIGEAAVLDWSDIDPSIFGTLFERGLDPAKRSQLGAHYTDPEKIMMIVRPVVIDPLWREWETAKAAMEKPRTSEKKKRELLAVYLERLKNFRVLDPACGSGNFLYLALLSLKDLEHRVNLEAEAMGFPKRLPTVGPEAVLGIELNPYAAELARVTVWIGEIQWMRKNGYGVSDNPVLQPLQNIENRDALLSGTIKTPWPVADAIVGNPPFLGDRKMIRELGEEYVTQLRKTYGGTVPGGADLVCYWFEKAWHYLQQNEGSKAGFVATNSITGGLNRVVLEPIASASAIFEAWDDEEWTVDGADVRVALICFSNKSHKNNRLNGITVPGIYSDLTTSASGADLTTARRIKTNSDTAFIGTMKNGPFNIPHETAKQWIALPLNPNGKPNSAVLRPWTNGMDITRRSSNQWIIDFDPDSGPKELALFEVPFQHVKQHVKPLRDPLRRKAYRELWWRFQEPQVKMRSQISKLNRYIVTPRVSKYRLFVWRNINVVPDSACAVVCRDDDVTFGILHSKYHEFWTLRMCTYLGVGNDPRYTPSSTFETFPFPEFLGPETDGSGFSNNKHADKIKKASMDLNSLRENWLNPPDLVVRETAIVPGYPDRNVPINAEAAEVLRTRTLTNLYNARPAWLHDAHEALDEAVAAAYGWTNDLSEDEILSRLLALNLARTSTQ